LGTSKEETPVSACLVEKAAREQPLSGLGPYAAWARSSVRSRMGSEPDTFANTFAFNPLP